MSPPRAIRRRTFLARVAALGGAAASAFPPDAAVPAALGSGPARKAATHAQAQAQPPADGGVRLDRVTGEEFANFLHDPFAIQVTTRSIVVAQLVKVTDYAPAAADGQWPNGRPPFALLFQAAAQGKAPAPQAIYAVRHAQIGAFPLFLVPVGRRSHVDHYEAVFG